MGSNTKLWLTIAAALISPSWCEGQTNTSPTTNAPEIEATQRFKAHAQAVATAHTLYLGEINGRALELLEKPILRWANPLGGRRAHGEVFLWTDGTKPAAVLSVNEYTDAKGVIHEEREWHSLSSQAIASVGPDAWSPLVGGVAFKPLHDEPPADSSARRLRQMRELASGFSGEKTTRNGEVRDLRILPQPAFRYEMKQPNPEILHGALFALVEANDPEVFVLLEARATGSTYAWHYALARMQSLRVAVSYRGQQIWEGPALPAKDVYNRTDKPYTSFTK